MKPQLKSPLATEVRILIVEDTDQKYNDIETKFREEEEKDKELSFILSRAKGVLSATAAITETYFDVVVLDLHIPLNDTATAPESCSIDHAKELYDFILNSVQDKPFLIAGLTALSEDLYSNKFENHSFFYIENYNSPNWFASILDKIHFVVNGKSAFHKFLETKYNLDVILLVARKENEYDPIFKEICWLEDEPLPHPRLEGRRANAFGKISLSNGRVLSVGLVCLGEMGLSTAASFATQLVHMFRPRYFAMLGMCCGFKEDGMRAKVTIGDIIIANQTANWDEGKYEEIEGDHYFHRRAIKRSPGNPTLEKVTQIIESHQSEFERKLSKFIEEKSPEEVKASSADNRYNCKIHCDLLVSGSSVVNSVKKVKEIRSRFDNAIGLEMEAHSVYSAMDCLFGVRPITLVIKGVADHGDGTKSKELQPVASAASYKTYIEFLEKMELGIE